MKKTDIEWADCTFNPITGCTHGCEYCYARGIARRFEGVYFDGYEMDCGDLEIQEYNGKTIYILNEHMYRKTKDGELVKAPYPFGFDPTLHRYRMSEPQTWKTPRTVFVGSMTDVFSRDIPYEWIYAVFDACTDAPQHRYLFLTKNPERYLDIIALLPKKSEYPDFWYGTTVTKSADCHASGRFNVNTFLSIEPLHERLSVAKGSFGDNKWIIIGAETGTRKGKIKPKREWIEEIVEAADLSGIPVFMKDSLTPIVGEENMRREFPWNCERGQHNE